MQYFAVHGFSGGVQNSDLPGVKWWVVQGSNLWPLPCQGVRQWHESSNFNSLRGHPETEKYERRRNIHVVSATTPPQEITFFMSEPRATVFYFLELSHFLQCIIHRITIRDFI